MILEKYDIQFMLIPSFGLFFLPFRAEDGTTGRGVFFTISWLQFGLVFHWFDIIKSYGKEK